MPRRGSGGDGRDHAEPASGRAETSSEDPTSNAAPEAWGIRWLVVVHAGQLISEHEAFPSVTATESLARCPSSTRLR